MKKKDKPMPKFDLGQVVCTTKPTMLAQKSHLKFVGTCYFKIRFRRWSQETKSFFYSPGPRWYPSCSEDILRGMTKEEVGRPAWLAGREKSS